MAPFCDAQPALTELIKNKQYTRPTKYVKAGENLRKLGTDLHWNQQVTWSLYQLKEEQLVSTFCSRYDP